MSTADQYFREGQLTAAIEAVTRDVKERPGDCGRRGFFAELLCFAGEFERADRQLEVMADLDSGIAAGVAAFRQLIRGELARREFFLSGRLPELIGPPPEHLRLALEASIRIREQALTEAASLLAEAERRRPRIKVRCNGAELDEFRDLDDLTAFFFEIVAGNGNYYVVPIERVLRISLRPPQRPRDLFWRPADLAVQDGPEGEVFLPVLYVPPPGAAPEFLADSAIRLGRRSDWIGGEAGPLRGIGQRCFLAGDETLSLMELQELELLPAAE
jgi:type VI secretion system protein ImpE